MRIFTSISLILIRLIGLLMAVLSTNYFLVALGLGLLIILAFTGKIQTLHRVIIEVLGFAVAVVGFYNNTYYELPFYLITIFIIFGVVYYSLAIYGAYSLENQG